jgi:hypothetical protein
MRAGGGRFYEPRSVVLGQGATEQCRICYGPGRVAAVGEVHQRSELAASDLARGKARFEAPARSRGGSGGPARSAGPPPSVGRRRYSAAAAGWTTGHGTVVK